MHTWCNRSFASSLGEILILGLFANLRAVRWIARGQTERFV